MSGGALEELGVSPEAVEECDIYQALLKVIDKRNLQAHHGTLDLVLALKELVYIRQRTGKKNPTCGSHGQAECGTVCAHFGFLGFNFFSSSLFNIFIHFVE